MTTHLYKYEGNCTSVTIQSYSDYCHTELNQIICHFIIQSFGSTIRYFAKLVLDAQRHWFNRSCVLFFYCIIGKSFIEESQKVWTNILGSNKTHVILPKLKKHVFGANFVKIYVYLALKALFLKILNNTKNKLNSYGHSSIAWENSTRKYSNLVPNSVKSFYCLINFGS